MNHKITLENTGKGAVKSFLFSIDPIFKNNVAFIAATVGSSKKTYLRSSDTKVQGHLDKPFWKIEMKDAIAAGGSDSVEVELTLSHALEMFPAVITQREKQFVRFTGNVYVYLPYTTLSQSTQVNVASASLESYTKLKPVSQNDNSISYGPYANIDPFSSSELVVHSENNNPMLVVSKLQRVIEISMWGNIAVEETIDVRHDGAALKGSFSRYEFQRENSGVSSVKNFKSLLPAAASNVYYRDDIGNISTSHMKVMDDAVELDLRPRFPLFGGWKTHYVIGYNVPSYEYIFYKGDNHVLNMRLIDHIFDDMLVENAEIKVILPEGTFNHELATPYPVKREGDSIHSTYLDTTGRPVITISNKGVLVENHIQNFQLQFRFAHSKMLLEPLLLVTAFLLFFLLSIIYVRLDFSITIDEGADARMKVAGYCEKVASLQDRRTGLYQALEEALLKLKQNKDTNNFQNMLKRINNDQKNETNAVAELQATIKAVSPDLGEKVAELQRLDKVYREQQAAQAGLVEKLVTGKLPKQQFIDQEGVIIKKKEEAIEKINLIVKSF
jgi:oligosaccharyltransferase complex subunit alpha (ribophorin I)